MSEENKEKKNKKIRLMTTAEIEQRIQVNAGGERSKYLGHLKEELARRKSAE